MLLPAMAQGLRLVVMEDRFHDEDLACGGRQGKAQGGRSNEGGREDARGRLGTLPAAIAYLLAPTMQSSVAALVQVQQ